MENESDSDMEEMTLTLAEALAKIHPSHLAGFLANSPVKVLELVDYFERALSEVSSVEYEYPWSDSKDLMDVIDVPFSNIPQAVYKTAADWINQIKQNTVRTFIMWSIRWTHDRLAGKPSAPKSQLGVLVALSIILRSKPEVLYDILPLLKTPSYGLEHSPEMVPFTVWMVAQVAQVDLCIGFHLWARNLLPLIRDKFQCNPRSMDLILQLIEKVLSHPSAREILLSNAARKEIPRLFPTSSFEMLLPLTFPASFERVNDTKRFEAVYPLLKKVALVDAPGRIKEMEQVTQHIFASSLKFAAEGTPVLAKEATAIAIWCLTKNVDCCSHWETVYMDNIEANVALLKKLVDEWKHHSLKLSSSPRDTLTLNQTMKIFRLKNKKGITEGGASCCLYEEADKYSQEISRRLSRGIRSYLKGCVASTAVILVAVGAAAAPMLLSSNLLGSDVQSPQL